MKKILLFLLLLAFAIAGLLTMQYFHDKVDPQVFQSSLNTPLSSLLE
ncbi:MAG: hypothetical protein PHU71_04765 [Candidatus Gracilibacteria bacterium]|nr:hypothetical protein [Candidatus Gracilibacteria bacterium]